MLEICTSFAVRFKMLFNPDKSVFLPCPPYHGKVDTSPILFNGLSVNAAKHAVHLGHKLLISKKRTLIVDHASAVGDFIAKTNVLCSGFKYVPYDIKYKLLKTYAHSWYGSVLWDFSNYMNQISVHLEKRN